MLKLKSLFSGLTALILFIVTVQAALSFSIEKHVEEDIGDNGGDPNKCGHRDDGWIDACNSNKFSGSGPGACWKDSYSSPGGCFVWQPDNGPNPDILDPAVEFETKVDVPFSTDATLTVWTFDYGGGTFENEEVEVSVNGNPVGTIPDKGGDSEDDHVPGPFDTPFSAYFNEGENTVKFKAVHRGGSVSIDRYVIDSDGGPSFCGNGVCEGNENSQTCPEDCGFPPEGDQDAACVAINMPDEMAAGSTDTVSVTMKNTGSTVWTKNGEDRHKLGSQSPQDNRLWRDGRVELTRNVNPGQSHTFVFDIKAPSDPGTYSNDWKMLQEHIEWFGEPCRSEIEVFEVQEFQDAQCVDTVMPDTMTAGSTKFVSVTMKNTGTTTWVNSGEDRYKLGSQDPQDNRLWRDGRVELTNNVQPGETHTFNFQITAPLTPATYSNDWKMLQEHIEWFGQTCGSTIEVEGTGPAAVCGNGVVESGEECEIGQTDSTSCGVSNVGECSLGSKQRSCQSNCQWGSFGVCQGNIDPVTEICDNKDNDCDGSSDEGGVCTIDACDTNSQCGTDQFTGSTVCQNDDVYQDFKAFTCVDPASTSSTCSSQTNLILKQDCGVDTQSSLFCQSGNVVRTLTDRGCSTGACFATTTTQTVQTCTVGCSNAQCIADTNPSVTLTANSTSGTEPLSVSFTCSTSAGNTPFTYSMDFGDGSALQVVTTSSTSVNFAHIYNDGSFNAKCTVTDSDSDSDSETLSIQVSKITIAPSISITRPTPGQTFLGTEDIKWNATDSDQSDSTLDIKVEYKYNGTGFFVLEDSTNNNDGVLSWDTTSVPNADDYKIRITVKDDDGLTAQDLVDFKVSNPSAPTVTITLPSQGTVLKGVEDIRWTATDADQADSTLDMKIEVREVGGSFVVLEDGTDNNDGLLKFGTAGLKDGKHEIRVTATDDTNLQGVDFVSTVTIDNIPDFKTREPDDIDGRLILSRVGVTEEVIAQGGDLIVVVNVLNKHPFDLDDLQISVVVPELGLKKSSRHFDVGEDKETTRVIVMETPHYAEHKLYDARITVSNDDIKRVKHRIFWIH